MKRLICFLGILILFHQVSGQGPAIEGCDIFPSDHIWNTPVDNLPVHARSDEYISSIGSSTSLHPDFGAGTWNGSPIGIPFNIVGKSQAKKVVTFDYASESDPGPYPIPDNPLIEGGPDSTGDRHILIIDRDNCILYELYKARPQPDETWLCGSGAIFPLDSYTLRPDGWTSADAAGLPILPGLARCDEADSGEIRHALRFTAQRTRRHYVWPARHYASSITDENVPPMGQRFRLKAGFDVSGYSPQVQTILKAMKKYGIILADNGSNWYISGVPDEAWISTLVDEFRTVKGSDFEAVDCSSLMIDPDSGKARQAQPDGNGWSVF